MSTTTEEWIPTPSEAEQADAESATVVAKPSLIEEIKKREFNPSIEPPPLRTIYSLAGVTICTPGNLTSINAAIKSGKSAALGAMSAAAISPGAGADLLGFKSSNPKSLGIALFDTEQSPDDFWHCNSRAIRRAGLALPPASYHAYSLTGLGSKQSWEMATEALKLVADQHAGIHSILIDGVADLVADVNDPAECNDKVATLHGMAIEYDCPIIGVIHFNPAGPKGAQKSRGHLGSQLERKAETNLTLEKDSDETTVIYSTKNRRAGIPKSLGPRFAYSVEAGMHVSVASRRSAKDAAEREKLVSLAEELFQDRPGMRYTDMKSAIMTKASVSENTAERRITGLSNHGIVKMGAAGIYTINRGSTF